MNFDTWLKNHNDENYFIDIINRKLNTRDYIIHTNCLTLEDYCFQQINQSILNKINNYYISKGWRNVAKGSSSNVLFLDFFK